MDAPVACGKYITAVIGDYIRVLPGNELPMICPAGEGLAPAFISHCIYGTNSSTLGAYAWSGPRPPIDS